MTRTRQWIAGTAALVIFMAIAGWLLLISPQRSEAAELHDAATAQRGTNTTLQVRLDELVAKSADLPALQARLTAVRARLPAQAQLPEMIRSVTEAATGAGMHLTGIVPSAPVLVTAGGVDAAADPAALSGEQLYAVNVSMTLTGGYAGVSSYINQLEELTRAFQVTGFTLEEDKKSGAATGSVVLSVQGQVFVLSALTPDVSAPETTGPAVIPAPSGPAPSGPAPSGTTPTGTTPTGTTPTGTTPTGTPTIVAPSAPAISY